MGLHQAIQVVRCHYIDEFNIYWHVTYGDLGIPNKKNAHSQPMFAHSDGSGHLQFPLIKYTANQR